LAVGVAAGAAGAAGAGIGVGVVAARRRRAAAQDPGSGSSSPSGAPSAEERYTCACGATYRTTGAGRHRVFWAIDAPADDPVLADHCPACERPWPEEVPASTPAGSA
jgi:hypothetical protein